MFTEVNICLKSLSEGLDEQNRLLKKLELIPNTPCLFECHPQINLSNSKCGFWVFKLRTYCETKEYFDLPIVISVRGDVSGKVLIQRVMVPARLFLRQVLHLILRSPNWPRHVERVE